MALLGLVIAILMAPAWASDMGEGCVTRGVCDVAGGRYDVALPRTGRPRAAYLFFHGYASSADAVMHDRDFVAAATSRNIAFVAVDGLNGRWSFEHSPSSERDDLRFIAAVLGDIEHRLGLGHDRIIIGGFSLGASMAWYTACHIGSRVAGSVTFSGVFWSPLPKGSDCEDAPPAMIHFHGRADRIFPLEGRAVRAGARQGDTFVSRTVMEARGGCVSQRRIEQIVDIPCEVTDCSRGPIRLCIHDGGHEVRADWLAAALDLLPLAPSAPGASR
ncbi:alpha/beta fold hydrolase [Roseomonas hellenica]|uniref:Alpha/beta fold hydrolase n=1 Tax=Plastoroseomonas hellenica TaxID=2687306 RepID=A0ABS5EWJ7_9PROT|nr:alpha/beta fold hydrolase [Plastoroseomonas hellenica]MBR0664668.1 alpha/beta fold hydrolase [Plastoroseomonas hellenica]